MLQTVVPGERRLCQGAYRLVTARMKKYATGGYDTVQWVEPTNALSP